MKSMIPEDVEKCELFQDISWIKVKKGMIVQHCRSCVNLSLRSQIFAIGEIRGARIGIMSRPAMAFGLV